MLTWVVAHPWAYPALEVVHLLGISLLLGNLVLFELRVWGVGAELPVRPLARHALSLVLCGFGLSLVSGAVMFLSQWDEFVTNQVFLVKMGLLVVVGANAWWFHRRGGVERLDRASRVQTALSLGLWVLVLVCGRFIAYV